jgi:hypothetical protein
MNRRWREEGAGDKKEGEGGRAFEEVSGRHCFGIIGTNMIKR